MMRRTVIITGATKGLGFATALEFAKAGHRIIGTYSTDDGAAEKARDVLKSICIDSAIVKHDVRDDSQAFWSSLDLSEAENLTLINNACAPFAPTPFHLVQWDDVQRSLDIGLKGSWLCSQALLRRMIRAGNGTIVNVLSAATQGMPPKGFSAYNIAKHAMLGLTVSLAAEYSAKGIRIFSVSPGFMTTALTANWNHRLVEAMSNGTDPAVRGSMIRMIIEDKTTIGRGEDYLL
jgi:NAD(P)-dependent dehydrogenase (short-subunit alcohol dehydrogenase family)